MEPIKGNFAKQLIALQPDVYEIEKKQGASYGYHKGNRQCRVSGNRLYEEVGPIRTFEIWHEELDYTIDIYSSHECFQKYDVAATFQNFVPTDGLYMPIKDYHCCYDDLYSPPQDYRRMFIFGDVYRTTTEALLNLLFCEETVKIIFSFGCSRQCLFKFQYDVADFNPPGRLSVRKVFSSKWEERSGSVTVNEKCDKRLAIFVGIVLEVCKYNFKARECQYFDLGQYLEAVNASPESCKRGHEGTIPASQKMDNIPSTDLLFGFWG